MAKKLKKRRKGINYQTIKIKNNITNNLNTIQEKIHYLSQEFRDKFAEESVGKVAEETEVVFVNDSQKENFSLVEFDSATADTLDGSTCVKEIVSKKKQKNIRCLWNIT